jgi:hypothetical protein
MQDTIDLRCGSCGEAAQRSARPCGCRRAHQRGRLTTRSSSRVRVRAAIAIAALAFVGCKSASDAPSHAADHAPATVAAPTAPASSAPAPTTPAPAAPPPAAPTPVARPVVPASGAAISPPADPGSAPVAAAAPKPPSTGKEMPHESVAMTQDQARKTVAEAVALMEKPQPPCEKIADALSVALPIAFTQLTPEAAPGIRALGKCAGATQRWRSVVQAGSTLLSIEADDKAPAQIVRALAEMGEYDKAIEVAGKLAKQVPKARPLLTAALTYTYCKAEAWDACVKTAEASIKLLKASKEPDGGKALLINRFLRDLGWVVVGKPKAALADLAAAEKQTGALPPDFTAVKDAARQAIDRGFYFEAVPLRQLPIGVYHLMGRKDTGALVTFKLHEQAGKPRQFRIEVEVPGVTERSSNVLALGGKQATVQWANPPLKMDLDPAKIRSPRPAQLAVKVVELARSGERVVLDETLPIEVLPRDYLPLRRKVGADSMVPTYGYLGAWITSNDKALEQLLTQAKARMPTRQFVGEQDQTAPQVKAIFDELKSRGVTYVMDPSVTSERAMVQRTRLPSEVLASTNAQCLEGTLLFASLFEAVGLRPIVVLVPGHAFVGWHTVASDGVKGEPRFVETTMVGGFSFEQAVEVATKRVMTELRAGSFKSGAATLIEVSEIRTAGFSAQPL